MGLFLLEHPRSGAGRSALMPPQSMIRNELSLSLVPSLVCMFVYEENTFHFPLTDLKKHCQLLYYLTLNRMSYVLLNQSLLYIPIRWCCLSWCQVMADSSSDWVTSKPQISIYFSCEEKKFVQLIIPTWQCYFALVSESPSVKSRLFLWFKFIVHFSSPLQMQCSSSTSTNSQSAQIIKFTRYKFHLKNMYS